jgi:uncharacterized protein
VGNRFEENKMDGPDLRRLIARCGEPYVAKRLQIQVEHAAKVLGPGLGSFHIENLDWLLEAFGWLLKCVGVWEKGISNIRDHKIVNNQVEIRGLPDAFEGLRILHLSDLHLDVFEGMGSHVGRICSTLDFDVALITGDFRFHTHSDYYPVFKEIEEMVEHLQCEYGCYGILGNHDFLEFVPKLEAHGVRMLLNESVAVEKDGARLWVVGLDDAHFYGVHDYGRAFGRVPKDGTKILMIHSPETLDDAYYHGADFVLSGHTHGGQVCLPGGSPMWVNANCSRQYCRGRWEYRGVPGYTSSGTGSSGLPVRFNCPPEIVVHNLVGRARREP